MNYTCLTSLIKHLHHVVLICHREGLATDSEGMVGHGLDRDLALGRMADKDATHQRTKTRQLFVEGDT